MARLQRGHDTLGTAATGESRVAARQRSVKPTDQRTRAARAAEAARTPQALARRPAEGTAPPSQAGRRREQHRQDAVGPARQNRPPRRGRTAWPPHRSFAVRRPRPSVQRAHPPGASSPCLRPSTSAAANVSFGGRSRVVRGEQLVQLVVAEDVLGGVELGGDPGAFDDRDHAAVHHEQLAVDPGGGRRGEIADERGDMLGGQRVEPAVRPAPRSPRRRPPSYGCGRAGRSRWR